MQEQLDGATRNKTIFVSISKRLQEGGYERDWQQCRDKIKNLKSQYKKVKDHNRITGNGRKTFPFHEQLDGILGHRPAAVPPVVLDAGSSTAEPPETGSGDGKTRAENA